ncbi:hypothetical protein BLNAU_14367 [Blattamonas nauphoetae]|uniref:Uncharacterized protein n=1 Tax=Blattamonas nauphoetae TaxID=2049346 RepID=A0ABQ9XKC7_9EUKA|nr:hypothetical protein BLNAU_14367 [Blattamonas nauphoetae]
MRIIDNTTQKEQITILSHHRVVISSGPSTKPELFVSPSSLSESEKGMIEVSGGRLWLRDVDVVLSDSPSLIFIWMVGGQLTMETCSLTGLSSSPTSNELAMNAGLCLWESGVLKLVSSKTKIKQTYLTHLSQGAINVKGGNLKIEGGIFHNNNPHSSSFPSLRRNILCSEGGEIEIGSLSGGDGKADHPHLWLSSSDCLVSGEDVNVDAPFFIPTLSSSSTSKLNKKEKAFSLTIHGITLIPCSLFLEVFEVQKDGKEGKVVRIPLSEDSTDSFNETHIEMSLPLSSITGFDTSLEWCGRLVYGQKKCTETSFVIQKSSVERAAQAMKENMKWWLPLVISLVSLLLLIIVVVFICWRRRKNHSTTEKGTKLKELDEEDEAARMELEQKMEETIPENSVDHLIKTQQTLNSHMIHPAPTTIPLQREAHQFVEVLGESGEVGVVDWMKADTLFDVLHRPEKKRVIDKKIVSQKMTNGLIRVCDDS